MNFKELLNQGRIFSEEPATKARDRSLDDWKDMLRVRSKSTETETVFTVRLGHSIVKINGEKRLALPINTISEEDFLQAYKADDDNNSAIEEAISAVLATAEKARNASRKTV